MSRQALSTQQSTLSTEKMHLVRDLEIFEQVGVTRNTDMVVKLYKSVSQTSEEKKL